MKKLSLILTAFILIMAAMAVYAEKPPKELVQFVGQYPVVHDRKCNVPSQKLKNVECLIFAVDRDTIFIVLFTDDQSNITQIIFANRQGEKVLWSDMI